MTVINSILSFSLLMVAGLAAAQDTMPIRRLDRGNTDPAQVQALSKLVTQAQASRGQGLTPPPAELSVLPNRNEMVTIARGHLNRIRTPFSKPVVDTATETAEIFTDGHVVHISTRDIVPIGLFVYQQGMPDKAISLSLVPSEIPPVDTNIILSGVDPEVFKEVESELSEIVSAEIPTGNAGGYVSRIRTVMRDLAQQRIPRGFKLKPLANSHPLLPPCWFPLSSIRTSQVLEGRSEVIFVSRVVNHDMVDMEIDEKSCTAQGVIAASAWPNTRLGPGEETELFVIVKRPSERRSATTRPSLLDRG